MDKPIIKEIKSASKNISCDLVIKNINIIDVFSQDIFLGDVAITNGVIVGIGDYNGSNIIDGTDKYICPGLIDSHIHVESSLTTPMEYAKAALLHGITTVIADPHEIANVMGIEGINLMLNLSKDLPLDFYFMLPSCVPATPFENSGAKLSSKDLKPLYEKERILGLGEVMDFPSVINCNEDMIDKLTSVIEKNKIIDGHGAGLSLDAINTYCCANIKTDHECISTSEALDRIRRGMYVLIREGTVAKNLKELLPLVTTLNSRRFCFCTDDKHLDDLIKDGGVDYSVRYAIKNKLNPSTAIQMATLNAAECYNLKNTGAIAPGYRADFIILDDLNSFNINSVYKKGVNVVSDNNLTVNISNNYDTKNIPNSVNIKTLKENSFKIPIKNKKLLNVIELIPNKLETKLLKYNIEDLQLTEEFNPIIEEDLLKIAVIERHHKTGNIGLSILKGLGIKDGAIATTIAHDSHNIIVAGTNDEDMLFAIKSIESLGGGIVVVHEGKLLASMALEIGGLMTNKPSNEIIEALDSLHAAIKSIAPCLSFNPFLTLSFLSLPVIPEVKVTDKGLFNVTTFSFMDIAE